MLKQEMSYNKLSSNSSILITLGHNSSVIFYKAGSKPIGYEEERLTGVKSDSSYPEKALSEVFKNLDYEEVVGSTVYISHWFDHFDIDGLPSKYFNHMHFAELVEYFQLTVRPLDSLFTHHDAHAYSTLAFAENFPAITRGNKFYIVMDGFGNNQEVLSIYEQKGIDSLALVKRVYGYGNSLGLLYQYATSFCGMKENQDEYKFLGYESDIQSVLTIEQINNVDIMASKYASLYIDECIINDTIKPTAGYGIIDFASLASTKEDMHRLFGTVIFSIKGFIGDEYHVRVIIGYFVQKCLENCITDIIHVYEIDNAYLSGGCFLNVKLNKLVLDLIPGSVCVNPLAGDQGAAIGMHRKLSDSGFNFSDLCFGARAEKQFGVSEKLQLLSSNVVIFGHKEPFIEAVEYFISRNFIVNIMHGQMEFGPRALCNTTTLALPTAANTAYINYVNNRNEVMPMAPVMLESNAKKLLSDLDVKRVIGSNKFMIITHDFMGTDVSKYRGIMHSKPLSEGYTCRPQIIDDQNSIIGKILSSVSNITDCLINTSFNTHGRPILFSYDSAIADYKKQKLKDIENKVVLIMLIN
jgi:predicted NodU family carbamoyl transferase